MTRRSIRTAAALAMVRIALATRPPVHRGWGVPEVLLSGDHEKVRQWRLAQSRIRAEQFETGAE